MKCTNCGFEYENETVCPVCGFPNSDNQLPNDIKNPEPNENVTTKPDDTDSKKQLDNNNFYENSSETPINIETTKEPQTNQPVLNEKATESVEPINPVELKKEFCKYCGKEIENGKNYCSLCGRSITNDNEYHCPKCGQLLDEKQKFCNNCGNKINRNISIAKAEKATSNLKTNPELIKKIKVISAIVIVIAILSTIGALVGPKVFISSETLLSQGDYEKAYAKARADEKDAVLYENIVAELCKNIKENLKNPDSFKLNNVWIDKDNNDIVIETAGSNSYGGIVSGYDYCSFDEDDNKYIYYTSVSDFKEETTYSFDDYSERLEKAVKNLYKAKIKTIINKDSLKIENGIVDRINQLNDADLLKNVTLIDEVSQVYPEESSSDKTDET